MEGKGVMSRIPVRVVIGLVALVATVFLTLPAGASQVNRANRVAEIWPNAVEDVVAGIWPNPDFSDLGAELLASG